MSIVALDILFLILGYFFVNDIARALLQDACACVQIVQVFGRLPPLMYVHTVCNINTLWAYDYCLSSRTSKLSLLLAPLWFIRLLDFDIRRCTQMCSRRIILYVKITST